MLYIRLFHGRKDPNQDMNEWGSDGPVFGPYDYVHTTYANFIRMGKPDGNCDQLQVIEEDMLYYDNVYYGDWSVFTEKIFSQSDYKVSNLDPAKAKVQAVS